MSSLILDIYFMRNGKVQDIGELVRFFSVMMITYAPTFNFQMSPILWPFLVKEIKGQTNLELFNRTITPCCEVDSFIA